jgi:Rieske Fe-S protein
MSLDCRSVTPERQPGDEPLWREHFPIDIDRETSKSRRAFLGGLTIAGGAMACGQAALRSTSSRTSKNEWTSHAPLVLDKRLSEMADGESLLFHYPDERSPCLLVKLSATEVVAFSQKCTHLACPVIPEVEAGKFHCPCHHGAFDIRTGQPLAGPPRTPLVRVRISVGESGTMTATGMEVG